MQREIKGSPGMKDNEENCVTNTNGTIFALEGYQKKKREKKE